MMQNEYSRVAIPSRLSDDFEAYISDEASIAASERCSPNSMEWEGVAEGLTYSDEFRASFRPDFLAAQGYGVVRSNNGGAWPVFQPDKVFHVGAMDPSLKGRTHNAMSHEGNGLSISLHPEVWREIARLGDQATWKLSREGARFLDVHSLCQRHRDEVALWAERRGLITMVAVGRVSWNDDEAGEGAWRRVVCFDMTRPGERRNAHLELAELSPESDPRIEIVAMPRATQAMSVRAGFMVPLLNAADIALTFYAEDVLHQSHGIDGVWWEDDLLPGELSAPRGTIHLGALPAWDADREYERTPQRLCAA